MEQVILNALERTTSNKKFNEDGFIAGVMYGDGSTDATSVKFELVPLRKILVKHGSNAKVVVKYGEEEKTGFIKEIQRHPVTAKITHIDVQLVSKDHEIKLQLPISYKGEENLSSQRLQLQVQKSEIDVFGKMAIMPDSLSVDVSQMALGDSITIKNFDLNKEIRVTDKEDEVYASITQMKEEVEEVVEEVVATPEAAAAEPEVKA
ncbi:50S ribosomal protein L25 [Clostridium estertheticum]|uniref:5S rRNA E-loop-binding protein n=1 Tax=Clostridium estertheticum subsp. estertheticum TaxID=1552 RepID=A0A1J0GFU2_9CLOT|nr:50S ribosomal protein L25 [Clostridium estertheticum]APC39758.1 5S rRNA E-loop-binding protein [Clostridium estertheticum subsp. estertheticum]MBU3172082.1 50S ribosomal protein L25 [Clostridium estertheticum]MBU3176006.1 50S ribosomal protein L25 [Clostridium estertheticum]MBU3185076.1 50S ribosomal protein L25 [Clostridium estertheticum]MBZ9614196.1 50S ribosomal protein L25 [Clostridium estertheticum subsp. laramiense]